MGLPCPLMPSKRLVWSAATGGEGEIRTPETFYSLLAFQASAFDHSATSPRSLWPQRLFEVLAARAPRVPSGRSLTGLQRYNRP